MKRDDPSFRALVMMDVPFCLALALALAVSFGGRLGSCTEVGTVTGSWKKKTFECQRERQKLKGVTRRVRPTTYLLLHLHRRL